MGDGGGGAFVAAGAFGGARRGYVFGTGAAGTGYYRDGAFAPSSQAGAGVDADGATAAAGTADSGETVAAPPGGSEDGPRGSEPWHWQEKDLLPFASAWLARNAVGTAVYDAPTLRVVVTEALADGECLHCRRKGEDTAVVSMRVKLVIRGYARVGPGEPTIGEGSGSITFREVGGGLGGSEGAERGDAQQQGGSDAGQVQLEAEVKVGPEARPGTHLEELTEEEYLTAVELDMKRAVVGSLAERAGADGAGASGGSDEAEASGRPASGLSGAALLVGALLAAVQRRVAGESEAQIIASEERGKQAAAEEARATAEAVKYAHEIRRKALPSKFAAAMASLADGGGEKPTEIDLSYAMLKDSELAELADGLKGDRAAALTSLDLRSNEFGNAGLGALVRALACGGAPSLARADLRSNSAIAKVGCTMLEGLTMVRRTLEISVDEAE